MYQKIVSETRKRENLKNRLSTASHIAMKSYKMRESLGMNVLFLHKALNTVTMLRLYTKIFRLCSRIQFNEETFQLVESPLRDQ